MREVVEKALADWKKLPASERQPGAVTVGDPGKLDKQFHRAPPTDGLILNVYTRILECGDNGECRKGTCKTTGGELSARDHLWLTKSEWHSLLPKEAKVGDEFAMPAAIAQRFVRFHLVDNPRGEPPFWSAEQVRKAELKWTVEEATAKQVR